MARDIVGSTSWHNRHLNAFERLNALLLEQGPPRPTILILGPGGVTRLFAPLLNDSAHSANPIRKLIGDAARYSDQLFRRLPFLPLRSLEPLEVSRTLTMAHDLIVVDRSRRVLEAVKNDLPNAVVYCVDISREPIPVTADVVISFNIICRLDSIQQPVGMSHVVAAVRENGLLLMDDRSAKSHPNVQVSFLPVCAKTYRKKSVTG